MARLYWRIKSKGKWTWRAASPQFIKAIEQALDLYGIDIPTHYPPEAMPEEIMDE